MKTKSAIPLILALTSIVGGPASRAADSATEDADVEAVRTRYWARGEEAEMGVVQNRTFSKTRKVELGLGIGTLTTDPFLAVSTVGMRGAYHFNETWSIGFLLWKDLVSASTALETFEDTLGATTNNNPPSGYLGVEGAASLAYGKLSLLGQKIIYYDLHVLAGAGATDTESGIYFTPHLGVGQQVFLMNRMSLRVDYRAQYYRETIIEKVITPRLGETVGDRSNWSHSIQLGVSFYIGGAQ
jgi:outer membrane beta-barrel protein